MAITHITQRIFPWKLKLGKPTYSIFIHIINCLQYNIHIGSNEIQTLIQLLGLVNNPNSLTKKRKSLAKNHVSKNCSEMDTKIGKKYLGAKPSYDLLGKGALFPSLTPLCAWRNVNISSSCAKNITHTQHSPTCCFLFIQWVTRLHSQQSRAAMPIDPLHQENFSVLTYFVNESATFFKVSTFISNTFSSTMSLTK
jgi:hypothetical protein